MHRTSLSICFAVVLLGGTACAPEKPKITADVVEEIGLHGTCKEDHANKSGEYFAVASRSRDRATGKTSSEGFAFRPPQSMDEVLRKSRYPLEYQPPSQIVFFGSLGSFSREHLTLHGLASQKCDPRPGDDPDETPDCYLGYPATCEMAVEKRGSQVEISAWVAAKLGAPANIAKQVGQFSK